jgi:hypothetical protein
MTTKTTSARRSANSLVMPVHLRPGMSPEEIYRAYGLTCPPRVGTLRDPGRRTYGAAVAQISARLGLPMMPHQRYMVDVALEVDDDAQALAYRDVTGLLPRQSGKTSVILPLKVHRAIAMPGEARRYAPAQTGRQRILYAAQKRIDARDKWLDDQLPILDASPYASRYRKRLTNGHEALIWKTGAYDGITSNTETAGHGKVLDLGVEDEFFAAEDARLEQAFSPAMLTRWSPQHWRVSTEGTERSVYLAGKVDRGREMVEIGAPTSTCYLEWSNLDDSYDEPATWLSCMPALCPGPNPCECGVDAAGRRWWRHTVTIATVRAELEKLGKDEFCRAYLNRRQKHRPAPDAKVPTRDQWEAVKDKDSQVTDPVALAVEVAYPTGEYTSIAVIGLREDGLHHLELIAHDRGTKWVVPRLKALAEKWKPVAVALDAKGPTGELLLELQQAGFTLPGESGPKRGDLAVPTLQEMAAACAQLASAVRERKSLRHRDQPQVEAARAEVRTRTVGDAWLWARKTSDGLISPWVAFTVGLWAFETRKHLVDEEEAQPWFFFG